MSEPGFIVSGMAHAALLVAALVVFADNRKFDDAQESIAVEVLTEAQVNEITKGAKAAKEVKVQAPPKAEKVAEVQVTKPAPPLDEAKLDVPVPPPPLKRIPDPGENDKPEPPKPTPQIAAVPPPRTEPVKVEPAKVEPPPEPPKAAPPPKAEVKKEPEPVKPPDAEVIEAKPAPPVKVRPAEKPKDEIAPKVTETKSLEQVTKEFEKKLSELPKPPEKPAPKLAEKPPEKAAAKPKSGDEENPPQRKYDPTSIAKLLSKEKPQQTASAAKDLNRTASLGSPTQNAQRMSPSLSAQLDGWMQERYLQCWSQPLTMPQGRKYIPVIRVDFNRDGSLATRPVLTNPPADPAWRPHAESAMRATQMPDCNPMQIPERFLPYYDQWKSRAVHFDRDEAFG